MTDAAKKRRSRLEIAAEAFLEVERERHRNPPELDAERDGLPEDFVQQMHRLAKMPRTFPLTEQMEYLRLWVVYEAARSHPLIEALSVFTTAVLPHRHEWEMRIDTRFPGHRDDRDGLRYRAAWRCDPSVQMFKGDWVEFARTDLGCWLRVVEQNIANVLGPG